MGMQEVVGQPFETAEEAWFWFIKAQAASNDGAQKNGGAGAVPRPCEPADILKILDRLYRQRLLLRDHLLVLRHYGRRQYAPNSSRVRERVACKLWREAFDRLQPLLEKKDIIEKRESRSAFERICSEAYDDGYDKGRAVNVPFGQHVHAGHV